MSRIFNTTGSFTGKGGHPDIEGIIKKFQQFMLEQYSEKDIPFLERPVQI